MPDGPAPERLLRNPLDPRNPLAGVYLATMLFELAEGMLRFLVPISLDARGHLPLLTMSAATLALLPSAGSYLLHVPPFALIGGVVATLLGLDESVPVVPFAFLAVYVLLYLGAMRGRRRAAAAPGTHDRAVHEEA